MKYPRRAALAVFLPIPTLIGVGFTIWAVTSTSLENARHGALYIASILALFAGIVALTAGPVNTRGRGSKLVGVGYGLALVASLGISFGAMNCVFFGQNSFRALVLSPLAWTLFYGWPVGLIGGLIFSRLTESEAPRQEER